MLCLKVGFSKVDQVDITKKGKEKWTTQEGDGRNGWKKEMALKQAFHLTKEGFPRGKKAVENSLITSTEAC